ncbi:MAG TPA: CRISPR system precrRNA processing endoribonuclease RAMP protein Cas6 [Accumulibacter sp.]|nr:CRISPR system precrRNA processing endoribonuclease RAMP protein Cas6 [Accumulibacter sp.]HNC18206.1 CRISPR system precrRNA processing endoribonuclease RAMP protein Cas6 [Accumulibacter sp.]HND79876.1 CRISPR system precrRNA processing endoribonuclease RAMP protein Cas6 [Accumulibacter sp.]HNJ99815.1 CRISPR system precrRNA processing endoribonuclease RAMP protein Cas6 [Accumulibacter sp.]HNL13040.1 CRISPR system precrRNA processing endoribonuclease RAMP protein Cas6 [Accumulibacter sp.]
MIAVEAALEAAAEPLPPHLGGILHGFVERALLNHAHSLMPAIRPEGSDEYANLAIEPPPYGQPVETRFRFGCLLFGDASASWRLLVRAILKQAGFGLNKRALSIRQVWVCQAGGLLEAVVSDGQFIDESCSSESPAWVKHAKLRPPDEAKALHACCLEFRSPLLLGSRGRIRRDRQVPWPTLKSVLDSIAKRMRALEPELANALAISSDWCADERFEQVDALTPAASPAQQVQWPYAIHRGIFKPGIVGKLIFVAPLGPVELALLEWGQWLGVGQQTTMGCGRYVLRPS